jgi:thiol-disulfide isomerase/thioredoxin
VHGAKLWTSAAGPVKLRPGHAMGIPALAAALVLFGTASEDLRVVPLSQATSLLRIAGPDKPTVLHFWATWCGACREEFPRLRKTLATLRKKGIAVLLVSIDEPEDMEEVKKDLRRFGVASLPCVVLEAPDPDPVATAVGDPSWDGTLPSTFLFDAQGKLRKSFIGTTNPKALNSAALAIVH